MGAKPTRLQRRIVLGALGCVAAYALVALRLADVTLFAPAPQNRHPTPHMVARADIVDRNGDLLARDIRVYDVYINAGAFEMPATFRNDAVKQSWQKQHDANLQRLTRALPQFTGRSSQEIARLIRDYHSYVLVARGIPAQSYALLRAADLPHVECVPAAKRNYPEGRMTAQVLGVTNSDGHGLSGLERGLAKQIQAAGHGGQVVTSLDMRVQFVLAHEAEATLKEFSANAVGALVLNVNSGEVLGLVSVPDFDPNDRKFAEGDTMRNIMTQNSYELGSVFKVFAFAMGLQDHTFRPGEMFPVGNKGYKIGRFTIHEAERMPDELAARDVLALSSNIGTSQIVLRSGADRQKQFLSSLGLLQPLKTELPESPRPLYPAPGHWGDVETATIGFGHGVSVTPLAYAAAAASIVNGGRRIHPTFLKDPGDHRGSQVISPATSAEMRQLLRYVATNGTGKNANVPGYDVGGKTGSAEKPGPNGGYEHHKLMTSFLGVFPMNSPKYLVFVLVDEAHATPKYPRALAGVTAAPMVGRIIAHIAPFLDVPMQPVADQAAGSGENS